MDPTVVAVIISSLSSIAISVGVAMLGRKKNNAEAGKTVQEADLIRRKLERGETADVLIFLEIFFELLDLSYGLVALLDRILQERPENCVGECLLNGNTSRDVGDARARLDEIHRKMRKHYTA